MVMELLGPNLETVLKQSKDPFAVSTAAFVGIQMLKLVRHLHSRSFIHRDIKPENFVLGADETVYLIDFGLAKRFRDKHTNEHIIFKEKRHLTGTRPFISLNTYYGYEQSRRDDLECLGYTLIYLLKGRLYWNSNDEERKAEDVNSWKEEFSVDTICQGMPSGVMKYLNYCRGLLFESAPDYLQLSYILKKANSRQTESLGNWKVFLASLVNVDVNENLHEAHNAICPGIIKRRKSTKPAELLKLKEDSKKRRRQSQIGKLIAGLPKKLQPTSDLIMKARKSAKEVINNSKKREVERRNNSQAKKEKLSKSMLVTKESTTKAEDNKDNSDICDCDGRLYLLQVDDESIPTEHVKREEIKIPVCTYINNAIHWQANKKRKSATQLEAGRRHATVYFVDTTSESDSKCLMPLKRCLSHDHCKNKVKRSPSKILT
eukprot:TRINITY_DN81_c0_g1_i21.p1 TRINITY_DN81_c0_g1~~TRINITY_DN81_c0_g1_i21.p1  ORF type:complete len:432 (-),score=79.53 TRINITY_DN81_c0_g1_i21:329-1624(-)